MVGGIGFLNVGWRSNNCVKVFFTTLQTSTKNINTKMVEIFLLTVVYIKPSRCMSEISENCQKIYEQSYRKPEQLHIEDRIQIRQTFDTFLR